MSDFEGLSTVDALERSLEAARHRLTAEDAAAVEVLRRLAFMVDAMSVDGAGIYPDGRPKPLDNVTIPTFLRYCDALGLTPMARERTEKKEKSGGGKLANLQQVRDKRPRAV